MSRQRKKPVVSFDWAMLFILLLSVCTNVFTILRYRRFVRDVDNVNKQAFDDVRKINEKSLADLRAIVNDFIGRSASSPSSAPVPSHVVSTNSVSSLPSLSPLPDGLWVASVNGEWLVTDGHFSYRVGSMSPIGNLIDCSQGVVSTDRGIYYSIVKEVRLSNE